MDTSGKCVAGRRSCQDPFLKGWLTLARSARRLPRPSSARVLSACLIAQHLELLAGVLVRGCIDRPGETSPTGERQGFHRLTALALFIAVNDVRP